MSLTLAVAIALGTPMPALNAEPMRVDLTYRSYRTWKFEMPKDAFRPLAGGIPLSHSSGALFASEIRGSGLAIDTNGDGTFDKEIEGLVDPVTKVRSARVTLRDSVTERKYAVRLQDAGKGWTWACGGAQVGLVGDTKIHLFDLNGNGAYNDIGKDAMAVGANTSAVFLSSTMHIGGALKTLSVAEDGTSVELANFEGATGTLNLQSKLKTKGKLMHAMVRSLNREHCFELAGASDGLTVPAGRYKVVSGLLGLGESTVKVDASNVKALTVNENETCEMQWGSPLRAEFDYKRSGEELTFEPDKVWLIGAAGERYSGWSPIGKSPEFTIVEKKLGTEIEKALFPGSC